MHFGAESGKLQLVQKRGRKNVVVPDVFGVDRVIARGRTAAIRAARRREAVLSAGLRVVEGRFRETSRDTVLGGKGVVNLGGPRVLVRGDRIVGLEILLDPRIPAAMAPEGTGEMPCSVLAIWLMRLAGITLFGKGNRAPFGPVRGGGIVDGEFVAAEIRDVAEVPAPHGRGRHTSG